MEQAPDTSGNTDNAKAFELVMRQALLPFAGRGPEAVPKTGGHHLYFEKHKGWMLRVTIFRGKKVVGKRVKFRMGTKDLKEAEKSRDLTLATLKRLGLQVVIRINPPKGQGRRFRMPEKTKETKP